MILGAVIGMLGSIPFLDNHATQFEFLAFAIPLGLVGLFLAWGIVLILNWIRAKRVTSKCIGVERAVQMSFEPDTDFVTLTFTDDRYADRFAAINADNRTY